MAWQAICFDADDTLWANSRFFRIARDEFSALLADYGPPDHLLAQLDAREAENVTSYGYGVKSFTLSMLQVAIAFSQDRVSAAVLSKIMALGDALLAHPVELLPHVRDVLEGLAGQRLFMITLGDLLDQRRKVAQSGLEDLFEQVEIVHAKTPETYRKIFTRYNVQPARCVMVGNSLRSDVLPVLSLGGWGVHVPHAQGWVLDQAPSPKTCDRFFTLPDLAALPDLLAQIECRIQA